MEKIDQYNREFLYPNEKRISLFYVILWPGVYLFDKSKRQVGWKGIGKSYIRLFPPQVFNKTARIEWDSRNLCSFYFPLLIEYSS
jgi:hypothetical protein